MRERWSTWGSHEPLPRGWRLLPLAAVAALLLAAPWTNALGGIGFAAPVVVLAVLGAAQELVTGRGGVVGFLFAPHAVAGGVAVAVATRHLGAGPVGFVAGLLAAIVIALTIEALLAALTWRAGRWVFTLASLAVAVVLPLVASGWDELNSGTPIAIELATPVHPAIRYAVLAALATGLWLLLLRFANSPFGRVLPALRDDPLLAETIGYRPALYRSISSAMAAAAAVVIGAALAVWQQSSLPLVAGSLDLALQVLLVGWVGGFGSMWAPPVGAAVVLAAWQWLPALLLIGAARVPDVPWLASLLSEPFSQRWVMAAIIGVLGWAIGGIVARGR